MKIVITIGLALFTSWVAIAQTSKYDFIREGGQISYLNPADSGVVEHTVSDNNVLPAKIAIGFPFRFNGAWYDSVGISENGYIWFGPAQPHELAGIINPITSTLPASVKGVVCAFGIDLHPRTNGNLTTTIRSKTQIWIDKANDFIVEWRNTSRAATINDPAGADTMGFQIQLFRFEDDRVQISYGYEMGLNPNINSQLSVGMKGASQADFALRLTDNTHNWDNTISASSITDQCAFGVNHNPSAAPHNYMSWVNKNPTSGLKKLTNAAHFGLYPNPVSRVLFIEGAIEKINGYHIFDMAGRLVLSGVVVDGQIFTENLQPGMYTAALSTANGVVTQRFSKVE